MSKSKDHDDPKAAAHESHGEHLPPPYEGGKATHPAGEKAAPDQSKRMYRVLKSISGGHEPGELKSHAELVGPDPARPLADVDWLVKTKGLEAVDHVHAAEVERKDLEDEIERLTHENAALKENLGNVTNELNTLRAQSLGTPAHPVPSQGKPPAQPLDTGRPEGPRKEK